MFNDLADWLQYLYSLPTGLNSPAKNFLALKKLATDLKLNKFTAKIITVAGTNGKGSTVAFLESILLQAGLKVATFTSPHLLKYNERIRINGKNISDKKLCAAFNSIEEKYNLLCRGAVIAPFLNFFAFTTLTALHIFQQQKFDVILLEVGLGGKYDAVNIVDPDIAIITTISLDHTETLGNTRNAIAAEKAGIMRQNKPVICGELNPPKNIFLAAKKTKAYSFCINKDFFYKKENNNWSWEFHKTKIKKLPIPHLPLQNAATTLMAIALLKKDFAISHSAIALGLKKANLAGRFQILQNNIILDVAHNPESAEFLALKLAEQKCFGRTIAVMSMLKDKDIVATIKPLLEVIDEWYVGILQNKRAATKEQLINAFALLNINLKRRLKPAATVIEAFKNALINKKPDDRIIVFGSFYTVAEILKFLNKKDKND